MMNFNFKKCLLPGVITATALFSGSVFADPPVLPPLPSGMVNVPPAVFCFKVTGGDVLPTGGARIQFEVLNWTGEDAHEVRITQNEFGAGNTGGAFAEPDPFGIQPNGWHNTGTFGGGDPFYITSFTASDFGEEGVRPGGPGAADQPQAPISFIDLDPNDDLDYDDAPILPDPVDSSFNVLDGFILEFPEWDVGERIVFQWELLGLFGNVIVTDSEAPVRDPYGFGTFQMDRASDGSVRIAQYFAIGSTLGDVEDYQNAMFPNGVPGVDLPETELIAETLGATALAAVPVPAAAWLMMSGLLGLVGVARRRRNAIA